MASTASPASERLDAGETVMYFKPSFLVGMDGDVRARCKGRLRIFSQ
jgi:hypothetical protein